MRRVSWASTSATSRSRVSVAARWIASLVISWNTIRLTGTLRLEHLEQVPRDGLALAVLISGEVELVGLLEQPLELGDLLLLVGVDDVVGLEAVVDVDAELAERALLHVGGQLRRGREVADVADRRLDVAVPSEVAARSSSPWPATRR